MTVWQILKMDAPKWARYSILAILAAAACILALSQIDLWQTKAIAIDLATAQRLAYLENNQETLDLAIEFGFDPLIVEITRVEAKRAFHSSRKPLTWRFIRSDRELAYLMLSLIQTESHGDFKAINTQYGPSSGIGLTQLLLPTAKQFDQTVSLQELQTIPRHMHIAVDYFVTLLEKFNGNYTLAVLAWNRGPGTVDRVISLGNSPENGYARAVFTQAARRNARN